MATLNKIVLNVRKLGFSLALKIVITLTAMTLGMSYALWDAISFVAAGPQPSISLVLGAVTTAVISLPLWPLIVKLRRDEIRKLRSSEIIVAIIFTSTLILASAAFYTRVARDIEDRGLFEALQAFAFAIALLGVLACLGLALQWYRRRRAPIVANLPRRLDEARNAFRQRVLSKFPPGTDEKTIVSVLRAQGFRRPSELGRWRRLPLSRVQTQELSSSTFARFLAGRHGL